MGLFEELDDMALNQLRKSELGDNRIYGTMSGIVTNNYNKDMPGKVCIQIQNRDKEANILKWAKLAMPYAGKKYGTYFVPEIGDQVLVVFEDGNIEKPFVIGCIPTINSTFVSQNADEQNEHKVIKTRNGNTISILDCEEGEGEKDKIEIKTSKEELQLIMDNENHNVAIQNKSKNNKISMNTENGELTINVEKKLKLKVGDIEINMNGESGNISIECSKYKLSAQSSIKEESGGMTSLEAENVVVSANTSLKAKGSSTLSLEGSVVKIG